MPHEYSLAYSSDSCQGWFCSAATSQSIWHFTHSASLLPPLLKILDLDFLSSYVQT